jgi:hypothetical protein
MVNSNEVIQFRKIVPSVALVGNVIYYPLVALVDHFYEGKTDPSKAWSNIKRRLKREGFDLSSKIRKVVVPGLVAADGKSYPADCATFEDCLRIVMSIDSSKAEPIKSFMAHCAAEKIRSMGWDATMIHARLDEAGLFDEALDEGKSLLWWQN